MTNSDQNKTDRLIDVASGVEDDTQTVAERRSRDRHPYEETVAIMLLNPDGKKCGPLVAQAQDISRGGIRVVTRQMIHVGTQGAIQLRKSGGSTVLVGVEAIHCRYIGDMEHHTGLRFAPLPNGLSGSDFDDRDCEIAGSGRRQAGCPSKAASGSEDDQGPPDGSGKT